MTYCLNVHDGGSWAVVRRALAEQVLAVKQLAGSEGQFPLSLHLGQQALAEAMQPSARRQFRDWMLENHCFLAGLNAFPFGHFHEAHVKEKVYRPNWAQAERLDYSRQALSFLADLMPSDWAGTITTVPGAWQADWTTPVDEEQALANLCRAGEHCRSIFTETGRKVRVAIEPEPGCAWKLFDPRVEQAANEICWCLDTCHAAVEFQSIEHLPWERIGRVQLSAAIECDNTPAAREALTPFAEPRYLHQTRAALDGEIIGSWPDLPPALAELSKLPAKAIVRTHYHVPLTWSGTGPLRSTRANLTPTFLRQAQRVFWEVETYTYSVFPPHLRPPSLPAAIAAELAWARDAMARLHP